MMTHHPEVSPPLDHVWDILSDDILATPAEELLAEMIEDGEDVDALAEEFQQIMSRAVRSQNRNAELGVFERLNNFSNVIELFACYFKEALLYPFLAINKAHMWDGVSLIFVMYCSFGSTLVRDGAYLAQKKAAQYNNVRAYGEMSDAWVKFAAAVEKVEAGVLTRHADAQVIRLSTSNFVDESPSATVNKASDKMVDWMSVGAINKPSVSTGEGRQDLITSIRAMTADAPSASSPSAAEALDHAKVSQAKRKIAVKFVNWTQIDPLEANARWQVNLAVMPQQDVGVSKNYEEALFRLATDSIAYKNLRGMYMQGVGVKPNLDEVKRLLRLVAAEKIRFSTARRSLEMPQAKKIETRYIATSLGTGMLLLGDGLPSAMLTSAVYTSGKP